MPPFGSGPENDPTPDAAIDPEQVFTSITAREFAHSRDLQPPPMLQAKTGRQDFDLNADARGLFESISHAFALSAVYDGDYPQTGTRIRFRIDHADYREAIRALEAATSSFVVAIKPEAADGGEG